MRKIPKKRRATRKTKKSNKLFDILLLVILVILIYVGFLIFGKMLISNLVNQRSQEKAQLILLPTIDPDPIVNCGPGENSGQYVEDRRSNCKNYTDCGLNNNTVWIMMLKADCDI